MGYDRRGYYYRSYWTPVGPRKQYIPPSMAAIAAMLDADEREKREARRSVFRTQQEAERAADADLLEYEGMVRLLTGAALTACGFHRHSRTWRLMRRKDV